VVVSIVSILLVHAVELEIARKEELEIANYQLRKLDEAKSEFLSIASHQLRTPLTSSNGFLSMVFEGAFGEIPEKLMNPLNHVDNANKRLLGLVEDLLNVSRIESGKMLFNFKEERIEVLLNEIVDSFSMTAAQKNIGLKLNLPKKLMPPVHIDRVKIREAISNTIDNAIKYSKEGTVSVSVSLQQGFVQIVIKDNGIGIAKEDLRNVFEKFSRGTNQNRLTSTGTGLGLYFGKRVIEANNGKIRVESEGPGKGSQFVIEIPVEKTT
jgi:signal transduction histidine kinase